MPYTRMKSALAEVRHDFFRKQLHGAQHFVVLHTTESEVAAEVGDALLLEFFDFGHTGLRGAENSAVLGQGLIAYRQLGAPLPPIVEAMVHLAAGTKRLTPLDHIHGPFERLTAV